MEDTMKNINICVVGLGGVGGYIGGVLAREYPHVVFLARGARKESISQNGLIIKSQLSGNFHVMPEKVTDNVEEIGIMDYVFICVKNYSLEQVCKQIAPIVNENTIIVPIMNGTNPSERTRDYLGKGIVIDSLIYIVSGSSEDFSIVQVGDYSNVHIGLKNPTSDDKRKIESVAQLLKCTGINCIIEEDIEAAIWKKYVLNCAYNVITAYYNSTTGVLRKDPKIVEEYKKLLEEACLVGRAKGVNIPEDLVEVHYNRFLYKLAEDSTSSLCRDMAAGKPNELETFSGYLLELGKQYGLELPYTEKFYIELKARSL